MNTVFFKRASLFFFLLCNLSLQCFAQQYHVHKTERTIRLTADNVSIYDISSCVGGVFMARNSNTNAYYIIDTLCNTLGAIHLNASFIPTFYGGKIATAILRNGTPAIINTKGEIVKLFPEGETISPRFVDGVALLSIWNPKTHESRVVYINEKGEQIYKHLTMNSTMRNINLEVSPLRDGRRRYYDPETNLYGFIDATGKIVIPARFKQAHDFSDGLAFFTSNEGNVNYWGYVDTLGKEVIKPKFRIEPGDFHDGYAIVRKQNGKLVFIDKEANVKTKEFTNAMRFFHGYALVNAQNQNGKDDSSKCYVIDTSFKYVRTIDFFHYGDVQYNEYNNTFIMSGVVFYPNGIMKLNPTRPGWLMQGRGFIEDIALYTCSEYTGFINSKGEVLMYFVESEF